MSEKDYSKLSGQYFDYKPYAIDMNNAFINIQSSTANIIGYSYIIKDGNKFMKYLDSITEDKSKLKIFDIDKNFKFDIENILECSSDKTLEDIANAEYYAGVYLGSLRVQPK